LVDDVRYLPVWVKVVGEVTVAFAAVALGFSWQVGDSYGLNAAFSVLWIVGLTNSFNLLDNMDGLASTVAAASLVALALLVHSTAVYAAPIAGATVAFFLINRPPAKMYMGDTGSLMLGFGVAICTISAARTQQGLHAAVLLMIPVALALFDTSLVIVSRLAAGRPIQLGGKDHFSHRLRMLGWSQYQVLAAAVVGCAGACAAAFLEVRYPLPEAWLALPIVFGFVAAWAGLLRVNPYASTVQPVLEVQHAHGV
jgi:UDP-GlcNAc:undecaprenyl-phosphate GlcNAc-1-phosphate transferase